MDNSADHAPRLVAAPRHLRRRILQEEIPDELLVPGAEPFPMAQRSASPAKRAAELDPDDEEISYRRKRLAALVAVIVVCISVPALIAALLLLG
ncbi:hypothetical protein [Pseudarthrobacter sp. 1C304]|uniref:hypothetical protein n=1 Tax=Pseudarthrobacter sp. 1C304 TaxID=3457438 RepID=UPI003FD13E16